MFAGHKLRRRASKGIVIEASRQVKQTTANLTVNTLSQDWTGAGSNRALVVFVANGGGVGEQLSTITFDGVAGTILGERGADGGYSCGGAAAIWLDADLPATSGTKDFVITLTGLNNYWIVHSIELSGVDQTTPTSGWTEVSRTALTTPYVYGATVLSQTGKLVLSGVMTSDAVDAYTTGNFTPPAGTTELRDNGTTKTAMACGYVYDAAASEACEWTCRPGGSTNIDSVVAVAFAVNQA